MKTNLTLALSFLVVLMSCSKESNCVDNPVCDEEFKKTYYRPDSSLLYTCIKSVPGLGSALLTGNARLYGENDGNGWAVSFYNYSDTIDWEVNEFWSGRNELVSLSIKSLRTGSFELINKEVAAGNTAQAQVFFVKWTNDSPLAIYQLDTTRYNNFSITEIDSTKMIIEGNFNLNFTISERWSSYAVNFADEISFTNGKFQARMRP